MFVLYVLKQPERTCMRHLLTQSVIKTDCTEFSWPYANVNMPWNII